MMNFKTPIYTLAAIALLSACSADESYKYTEVDPEAPITMSGAVNNGEQLTRKAIEGLADGPLTISLFREDETYGTTYTTGPVTVTLGTNGTIATGMFYLAASTAKSKIIGLYPNTGTYASASRKVTYTAINGATDIMASNQVEGSKGSPVTTPMKFDHLLTRVSVNIQATAEGAGKWGAVNSISVADKKQDIVVTLPAPNTTGLATIATAGTAAALLLTTDAGDTPETTAPTTTGRVYGQAMFAPVTTAATLTLSVVTANGTFSVTTNSQLYEAGKKYTLNLSFGATGITLTDTTISPWGNGGTQPEIEL